MSFAEQNPYQTFGYGPVAALAEEDARIGFIRRTYLHLAGAVLAFVAIEAVVFNVIPQQTLIGMVMGIGASRWTWLLVLGAFMAVSWLARSWAQSGASVGLQYAGLGLYVVAQAAIFVPLLTMALYFSESDVLSSSALITLLVFGGLTATVLLTKADFSFLRMYLALGGLAALGFIIAGMAFGFDPGLYFSLAMVVLASGYILFDTSNVLHQYRTDQHVAASLALFASVALLFWYVLQIMMRLSNRN